MKILVIDEWIPWPLESGKKIRTFNLISRLAKIHEILYLAYVNLPAEVEKIRVMKEYGIRVIPVKDTRTPKWSPLFNAQVALSFLSREPFSSLYHIKKVFIDELKSVIRQEKPDLVHCEWTNLSPFLEYVNGIPCVISAHNVESDIWRRFGEHGSNIFKRAIGYSQAKKIERLERQWYPRVEHCIAVSNQDRKVIESYGAKVSLVDNGVDLKYYKIPSNNDEIKNSIIFTASFDTFSNQDGAEYFVKDIYPLIKSSIPDIHLWLVGKDPSERIRTFPTQDPSIHVTGTVEDVREYISKSTVCVVPLQIGGGSRLKILEALAMRKAVVSTTVGAEGLLVNNNKDILLADTPQTFSDCVITCISNVEIRQSLSNAGYDLVRDRYDWDMLADINNMIWENVVNRKRILG